jgi:hypothetical protein
MHGHRQVLLDETKEGRFFSFNVWLNYPHPDQFEGDLFRTRLKWWEHHVSRGHVVIRERPPGKISFNRKAEMRVIVSWPVVGEFRWEPGPDPWRLSYDAKKLARAKERRAKRLAQLRGDEAPAARGIDPRLLDEILAETKR